MFQIRKRFITTCISINVHHKKSAKNFLGGPFCINGSYETLKVCSCDADRINTWNGTEVNKCITFRNQFFANPCFGESNIYIYRGPIDGIRYSDC